jgi:hypothetical protein
MNLGRLVGRPCPQKTPISAGSRRPAQPSPAPRDAQTLAPRDPRLRGDDALVVVVCLACLATCVLLVAVITFAR